MKVRISFERIYLFSYFIGLILFGSFLLMLPFSWQGETPLSYVDALFTSTSAVCVTGLSTVDTTSFTKFGQSVILFLIQFGGLGIVTFTTLYMILPRRKISLVSRNVVRDYYLDEIEYDPKNIMIHILVITLFIESLGAFILYFQFSAQHPETALFDAIFHSVSAFCNAGFSTYSDNLESHVRNPVVNLTVVFLIVTGGLGFLVLQDMGRVLKRTKPRLSTYSGIVLKSTALLIAAGWIAFFLLERNNAYAGMDLIEASVAALFQSVTPRTAGFDTVPQFLLSPLSVIITIILMFIGGSSGSIAGGIKTSTFYLVVMSALHGLDEKGNMTLKRRSVPAVTILKANAIIIKALLMIVFFFSLVAAVESVNVASGNFTLVQVLFETVSAFGTVGLSLGITMKLGSAAKLILVAVMFIGRVGIAAMAWRISNDRLERFVDYPETQVMVG